MVTIRPTVDFRRTLGDDGLVAIVRGQDPGACYRSVECLADAGIPIVEVSLTTTDALAVLERVASSDLDVILGAGTVLTERQARDAYAAGATFMVTPGHAPGADAASELGLPVLCGCATPTEVARAHQAGQLIKLFPASQYGPGYLKALRDPFPNADFVPVGGVDERAAAQFLAAGSLAVGIGSPLLGDAPHGGDLTALAERARRFRRSIDAARQL